MKTPEEGDKLAALGVSAGEVTYHPTSRSWTLPVTLSVDGEGDSPVFWQVRRHPSVDWHTAHITAPQEQRRVLDFSSPGAYDVRLSTSTPGGVIFSPTVTLFLKDTPHD